MLPLVLFVIGMCIVIYRIVREPEAVWFLMLGAYVYFAIPSREFRLPGAPYQPLFYATAIALSFVAGVQARRRARKELEDVGLATATEATEKTMDAMVTALLTRASQRGTIAEIREAIILAGEHDAVQHADENCPEPILAPVQKTIRTAIASAANAAATESQKVLETASGAIGNIRAALDARVTQLFKDTLAKDLDAANKDNIARVVEEDAKDVNKKRGANTGPLGIPMPRKGLTAILTNAGFWLFVTFTVLTRVGAQFAKNFNAAYARYMVCLLLLPPLFAIMTAVKTPRHFRMFTFAWLMGVWHLSMNGIMLWVRFGGRADDVGGQGGEANFLGAIITAVAPVAFSMAINDNLMPMKLVGLFFAGCYFLGVLASGSRGALLALIGSMAYWVAQTSRKGIALSLVLVAAAGFLAVSPPEFWERMGTMFGEKDNNPWIPKAHEPSAHERQILWALAIDIWKENPWFGIGAQNYVDESGERTTITDAYHGARGMMTHNSWLQILSEYGTVGILVWAGAYFLSFFCFRAARGKLKPYPQYQWLRGYFLGFETGIIGGGIAITFSSFQWYDYLYWTMVTGPLALQIATETAQQMEWYKPRTAHANEGRPPPRYGPPRSPEMNIQNITLENTPVLQLSKSPR